MDEGEGTGRAPENRARMGTSLRTWVEEDLNPGMLSGTENWTKHLERRHPVGSWALGVGWGSKAEGKSRERSQ